MYAQEYIQYLLWLSVSLGEKTEESLTKRELAIFKAVEKTMARLPRLIQTIKKIAQLQGDVTEHDLFTDKGRDRLKPFSNRPQQRKRTANPLLKAFDLENDIREGRRTQESLTPEELGCFEAAKRHREQMDASKRIEKLGRRGPANAAMRNYERMTSKEK